jgi:DNA-binding transcriptional MerR regulator
MPLISMEKALPFIPAKRYFTIGEVSGLCGVKPYVLRYWEQEFTQLKPMKRRGNRRYYQHHEVLLIRRIRDLLYDQGFTISGARNRLSDVLAEARLEAVDGLEGADSPALAGATDAIGKGVTEASPLAITAEPATTGEAPDTELRPDRLRAELLSIRDLLSA